MALPEEPGADRDHSTRTAIFLDASDAWLRRFGYSRDEITNVRPQDLGSPESAKRISEEFMPVLRRTGRLEWRARGSAGRRRASASTVSRARSSSAAPTATTCARSPCTPRSASRRGSSSATASCTARRPRCCTPSTPPAESFTSAIVGSRSSAIGARKCSAGSITDFMGTEFQTTLGGGRLQDVIAQGELENEPRTYVTKSGELVEVELSATADRDSTGAVVALMVASKDVTERNRAGAPIARGVRGERAAARRARARARLSARGSAACR